MDSMRELSKILGGTMLAGREMVEIPVLETGEKALAVQIAAHETEAAWRVGRSLLSSTRRWPLVASFWSGEGSSWSKQALSADLFSRFYYKEAPVAGDVSPPALCAKADHARPEEFLKHRAEHLSESDDLHEMIVYKLTDTQDAYGSAPHYTEVVGGKVAGRPVSTTRDVERFLLDWEEERSFRPEDPEASRQPWFEQDPCALLFMPSSNGWDALAYIHWYGSAYHGVENYIALGRSWERRFGAELVAHHGTMLQCLVSRPPQTIEEAWPLACEHELTAQCTLALPGISLRDYTRALIEWDRWFLHERP